MNYIIGTGVVVATGILLGFCKGCKQHTAMDGRYALYGGYIAANMLSSGTGGVSMPVVFLGNDGWYYSRAGAFILMDYHCTIGASVSGITGGLDFIGTYAAPAADIAVLRNFTVR